MKPKIQSQKGKTNGFIKSNPDLFTFIKEGDLVEGEIMEKSPREVLIDLGKYGTGIVYRGELINARGTMKDTEVGDTVQAKVLEVDNDEGLMELSLSEAAKKKNWLKVQKMYKNEETITTEPTSANKGGLIFRIHNLKAFLPASQLTPDNYPNVEDGDKDKIEEELEGLVGEEMEIKIITADPKKNKLIVSERAAKEESAKELAKEYEEGEIIEGTISGLADFGAFVQFKDNPEVEGLIHISELTHKVIEDPSEIVESGDEIEAKIIDIKEGKISLSLKALQSDPWEEVSGQFEEGQEVKGTVYSFNPFGATVELSEGIQGQVHVTQFGGEDEMKESLDKGEEYTFKVKEVKEEDQRINLEFIE